MIYTRICYENGDKKHGKKIYELHKFCECDGCKSRFEHQHKPRNTVTVTVRNHNNMKNAKEFIENWTCKDGSRELPCEYHTY